MAKTNTPKKDATPPFKFEEALVTLEGIVRSLEEGQSPLGEAMAAFEKGVALANQCQHALENAERRIEKILTDSSGNAFGKEEFYK